MTYSVRSTRSGLRPKSKPSRRRSGKSEIAASSKRVRFDQFFPVVQRGGRSVVPVSIRSIQSVQGASGGACGSRKSGRISVAVGDERVSVSLPDDVRHARWSRWSRSSPSHRSASVCDGRLDGVRDGLPSIIVFSVVAFFFGMKHGEFRASH